MLVTGSILLWLVSMTVAAAPLANRPDQASVAPLVPLPIDGVWRVHEIGIVVHINRGRVITLTDYVDVGYQVKYGMVLVRDLVQTGPGAFKGHDPGWNIPVTYQLRADGVLMGTVHSLLGPVPFTLTSIELAVRASFQHAQGGGGGLQPRSGGGGSSGECKFQSYDANTGKYVCVK